MKIFKLLLLSIAMFMAFGSSAQVAINTDGSAADASAILDVKSENMGLLLPRMTSSQRDAIGSPATGLTVFVTNDNLYYFYDGSTWNKIANWTLSNTSLYIDTTLSVGIGTTTTTAKFEVSTLNYTGTYGANICTGGTPTASEEFPGQPVSNVFDNNTSNYWSNNNTLPSWIEYDLGSDNEKRVAKYRIYYDISVNTDNSPNNWSFEGSSDGSNWISLDNQTSQGWSSTVWKEYIISNTTEYRYYRLNITDNQGAGNNYVNVYEMEMFEENINNHTTLFVNDNKVGIGTASPDATLHIDGSLKYVDGNESTGKILASDASGNVSWTDGSTLGFGGWVVNGSSVYNMSPLVGIGTSSPSAGLEIINSTADNSLHIENNSTTASNNRGIYTYLSGGSHAENIGSYIHVANTGGGSHYGSFTKLIGAGGGAQVGAYYDVSNTGNNYHYGILTSLSGTGVGRQYGIYHNISNTGNSYHYGTFNNLSGSGTGNQYGTYQSISNTGSGVHYGNYNELMGSGVGTQFGNFTYIYNTGLAKHYGSYDSLTGVGNGAKYGVYSVIPTSAGGTHYGLYSNAEGNDNYSAYLVGRVYASDKVGIGTDDPLSKLSIYNSDTDTAISLLNNSTSSNDHFGAYTLMTGTGTGKQYGNYHKIDNSTHDFHYGNYNSLSGSGAGKHYGVYNNMSGSGIGANYGVYNYLSSSGGANKYGTYSEIDGQAGGTHYAVYGKVFDDGSNYAGFFMGPIYSSSKMGLGVKNPEVMLDVRGDFQLIDTANDVSASIESTVSGAVLSIKSTGSNLAQVKFINNENTASMGYDVDNNSVFISQGVNTIFIKGGNILPQTNGVQSLGNNSSSWNNIWFDDLRNKGAASFTDRKVTEEILLFPPLAKKSGNSDNKTKKGLAKLNPSSLPNALYEDNSILIDEVAVYNYKANYEQQLQIEELKAKIEQQNEKIEQLIKLVSEK